jgi:hypothetical protein
MQPIELDQMRLTQLRKAIRGNRVSFPSQIPLFVRSAPANVQRHAIQLYFLRGWNCGKIARRYGYSRFYIWRIVNEWKRRAVAFGYVQPIPAGALTDLKEALERTFFFTARLEQEALKSRNGTAATRQPLAFGRLLEEPNHQNPPHAGR